jgi:hypothetical protein
MDAASDEREAKEKERELDVQRKEAEREEDKRAPRRYVMCGMSPRA